MNKDLFGALKEEFFHKLHFDHIVTKNNTACHLDIFACQVFLHRKFPELSLMINIMQKISSASFGNLISMTINLSASKHLKK